MLSVLDPQMRERAPNEYTVLYRTLHTHFTEIEDEREVCECSVSVV